VPNPELIAQSMLEAPPLPPNPQLTSALAYSAKLLLLTAQLVVDNLAVNYRYVSSIRHAIGGLESTVLLARWLVSLQNLPIGYNLTGTFGKHRTHVKQSHANI
jgi:hypothetical protein